MPGLGSFYFRGRTFSGSDRLKLSSPLVTPPGAGLIGLVRPTSSRQLSRGFYTPGGGGGWVIGRGQAGFGGTADRLGLYRPVIAPTVQGQAGAAAATVTTGSFTPPANCLLFAIAACRDTAAVSASSPSDSLSGAWTLVPGLDAVVNDGTAFLRLRIHYRAIGNSPAPMTVSSACTGADQHGLVVVAVPGASAADFANLAINTAASASVTATLPSTPGANDYVLSGIFDRNFPGSITPPSGYSELLLQSVGTNGKLQICKGFGNTGTGLSWSVGSDGPLIAVALEIRQLPLIEHSNSSANWVNNNPQVFMVYTANASEHYLALNSVANLEKNTTTIPLDSMSAMALGTLDIADPRSGVTGDEYWIGVLKGLPPNAALDPVMRQLAPPTTLAPWLAHLFPLQGRSPERCILTGASLVVDAGTSLATSSVMQLQRQVTVRRFGSLRYRARLELSYGGDNLAISPDVDLGPTSRAAAVLVQLPAGGATAGGIAANGDPLTPVTLPGGANAQSGSVVVGTDIVNGAGQSEPGTAEIAAVSLAAAADDVSESMWAVARDFLSPTIAPIALGGSAGSPQTADLAAYITDPSGAGYDLAVSSPSAGLSASISGTVLTYSAAVESDSYGLTLTVTSRHDLGMATHATVSISLVDATSRYANGYRGRCMFRLWAWPSGGSSSVFLLPFAEKADELKTVAHGGLMQSANGWDFRLETSGGTKLKHVLAGYDPASGLIAGFVVFPRDFTATEFCYGFAGKPGLVATEEDAAGVASTAGLLYLLSGASATDYSGQGRNWTTSNAVGGPAAIGNWPAGIFDGSTSYRARSSAEMNARAAITVAGLAQSPEAVGRTQEFVNVAPADIANLALRLGSSGNWVGVIDAGALLQSMVSSLGLYYQNRGHSFGVTWASGARPQSWLDGALIDLDTPPAVATGTTTINEVLELGRGNRPPGTASYWNGLIGPLVAFSRALGRSEIECFTAGLSQPRLVYGLGGFKTVDTAVVPPIAQPVEVTVSPGATSAPIDVQAAAYNPDGLPLTTTAGTPTAGDALVAADGKVLLSMPAAAANQLHYIPYTLTSGLMSSSSIVRARVGPPVVTTPAGLPTWPVSYTGGAYYVQAGATRTGLSGNNRQSPNSPQWMLDNAPSLSTIIFLGAGPYPNLTVNRLTNVHLKLIADVPAFSDLINLRPQTLTVAQLNTLEDIVVKDKNLTTSCRLQQLLLQAGGYIWVEGFRSKGDRLNVTSGSASGRSNVVGSWFEKIHIDQAPSTNMLIIGPANGANKINVVHKFWCKSFNELGDPGFPAGGTNNDAGTAVTDYGIRMDVDCGAMQILECFFQMRSNHMIAFKRGNGANDAAMKNRIEGCLFASWNRAYSRTNTAIELGQECDDDSNGDTTIQDTDILNNTFADPNMVVLMPKNITRFLFNRNRIILHNRFMIAGITNGYTGRGKVIGPLHPGSGEISDNIIMESSPSITLYSVGTAARYTFARNTTQNLIGITTNDSWWLPQRMASGVSSPRIDVVLTNGGTSGFGPVTNA